MPQVLGRDGPATTVVSAAVVALAAGVLTAFAQKWLPDDAASLANSAGPWSAVAALLALQARRRAVAVGTGMLALWLLEVGYVIGSRMQGNSSAVSTVAFWLLAGLVAGPVLGLAAHTTRHGTPVRAGLGAGVLAGVLVGEGAYGLTAIADTTGAAFWWVEIVVGGLVLVAVAVWRLRRPVPIAAALVGTAVVAGVLNVVYRLQIVGLL